MAEEINDITTLPPMVNKIDPVEFDVTISALLIGLGAEKYIDIFRKRNIGQCTLTELTDEDLIKLGLDNADIRKKLLEEVRNLPVYEESSARFSKNETLSPMEIADVLEESSQHLYRVYLSMLANTLAVKKTKKIADSVIYQDKYASNLALATLSEITNTLNSIEITLHTQMKDLTKDSNKKQKKIIVGSVGGAVIILLTTLFIRSVKNLK